MPEGHNLVLPRTCSKALSDRQTPPGSHSFSTRAATLTAIARGIVGADNYVADIDTDAEVVRGVKSSTAVWIASLRSQ
jgi:hypothetical protein